MTGEIHLGRQSLDVTQTKALGEPAPSSYYLKIAKRSTQDAYTPKNSGFSYRLSDLPGVETLDIRNDLVLHTSTYTAIQTKR